MRRLRVPIFQFDKLIARSIAHEVSPKFEHAAQQATRLADEHFLLPLSLAAWVVSRPLPRKSRSAANHVLLTVAATSILPHVLKRFFAQERPDRVEVGKHRHGVPKSGKAFDAFPSGHAIHMGALASAAARIWPNHVAGAWTVAALLSLTRVAVLAHWASDVLVGGALGVGVEHLLNSFYRDKA
jgi:membrane-associated phospholipid phosphatase